MPSVNENHHESGIDFCWLLIAFPNSLDAADQHNVGPYLQPNRLTL